MQVYISLENVCSFEDAITPREVLQNVCLILTPLAFQQGWIFLVPL